MKKIKQTIAKIVSIALVGTLMLYSPQGSILNDLTNGKGFDMFSVQEMGVEAASAGNGTTMPTVTSGTQTATGWGTLGVIGFRVFPASIDSCITDGNFTDGDDAQGDRYDLSQYSLYVFPSNSGYGNYNNCSNVIVVSEDGTSSQVVPINGADAGVVLREKSQLKQPDGVNEADFNAFANFMAQMQSNAGSTTESFYSKPKDGVSAAESMVSGLNYYCSNSGDMDAVYRGYLAYINSLFDNAGSLIENLYTAPSAKMQGSRNITLVVEPMVGLRNQTDGATGYISLYEGLKTINNTAKTQNYKAYCAKPLVEDIANTRGRGDNFNWCSKDYVQNYVFAKEGIPWTSAYLLELENSFPTVVGNEGLNATMTKNHCGWWWVSIAGTEIQDKSTYGVGQENTFNGKADSTTATYTFDGTNLTVPLSEAYVQGHIEDNQEIVQNYYKKTAVMDTEDIRRVLNMQCNDSKFKYSEPVALDSGKESAKKDTSNIAYYHTYSPYQDVTQIGVLNNLKENKQDYLISVKDIMCVDNITNDGNGNYSYVVSDKSEIDNLNRLYGVTDVPDGNYSYELAKVKVGVYERVRDTQAQNQPEVTNYFFEIPVNDFLKEIANYKNYDLIHSSITDTTGTIVLGKYFEGLRNNAESNKDISILVTYDYKQSKGTHSYDGEGYFSTHIPEYAVNNAYTKGISGSDAYRSRDNVDGQWTDWQDNKLVTAKIYAPELEYEVSGGQTIYKEEFIENQTTYQRHSETGDIDFGLVIGSDGDEDAYYYIGRGADLCFANTLPVISAYKYLTENITTPNYTGRYGVTVESEAQYDAEFKVKKNAGVDKLAIAYWVEGMSTSTGDGTNWAEVFQGSAGGTAQSERTITGKYTFGEGTIDIPIRRIQTNANEEVTTEEITKQAKVAESRYDTDLNIRNYVSDYIPYQSVLSGTAESELTKTSTDTDKGKTYKYGNIKRTGKIKYRPEVTMMGYPTPGDEGSGLTTITTQGNQPREAELLSYNTISINMDTNMSVTGTAIATDSRVAKLRNKYGNVPVMYGGSETITVLGQSAGALEVHSYVLDVNTTDGNIVLERPEQKAKEVANSWLNGMVTEGSISLDLTSKHNVYTSNAKETPSLTYAGANATMNFKQLDSTGAVKTTPEFDGGTTYNLFVNDGVVYKVTNSSGIIVTEQSHPDLFEAIEKMQLNEMFSTNMETSTSSFNTSEGVEGKWLNTWNSYLNNLNNGKADSRRNHWYAEATSIFTITDYTAQFVSTDAVESTAKIPLNAGPSTPSNSNNYFSNGYPVTIDFDMYVDIGGTKDVLYSTDNKETAYIIADVTVENLTNY